MQPAVKSHVEYALDAYLAFATEARGRADHELTAGHIAESLGWLVDASEHINSAVDALTLTADRQLAPGPVAEPLSRLVSTVGEMIDALRGVALAIRGEGNENG